MLFVSKFGGGQVGLDFILSWKAATVYGQKGAWLLWRKLTLLIMAVVELVVERIVMTDDSQPRFEWGVKGRMTETYETYSSSRLRILR